MAVLFGIFKTNLNNLECAISDWYALYTLKFPIYAGFYSAVIGVA